MSPPELTGSVPPPLPPQQPKWIKRLARGALVTGFVLAVLTALGGASNESLGVVLAVITSFPLGFGIFSTVFTRRMSIGIAKPIISGFFGGGLLFVLTAWFFVVVFPKL